MFSMVISRLDLRTQKQPIRFPYPVAFTETIRFSVAEERFLAAVFVMWALPL